jgi:hypothetical protein
MNYELIAIQKECRRRGKEFGHTADADARAVVAADNKSWCELHLPELVLNYKSKCDEYWRHYKMWFGAMPENPVEREINDQVLEAERHRVGRLGFLLVETIAGAVLAAIFFNAPRLVAAVIGVVLAGLMGAAGAAVVTRWVRHMAAEQPSKQLERITRGLVVLGLLCIAAIVAALAILRGQGMMLGGFLFSAATTAVSLLAPLCSGLCGYAADLLFWSKRMCADLRWIRSLARELDHLLTISVRSIPPGPGGAAPATSVTRALKAIAPAASVVGFVIAVLLGLPAASLAADLPVYLYPDVSPSARGGDVIHVLKGISSQMSTYEGENTLVVTLIPFYEDAYMASSTVRVGIPGHRRPACPDATTDSEIARLSKTYAESARRDAARQCEELRAQAHREDATRRAAGLAKLAEAIEKLSGLSLPGHCTAVNAMIRRAGRETPNGISIMISDLENTCPSQGLPASLHPENQVFIIPVGSRQHPIEAGFDAIQSRFAQTMPWIRVIEPFRLDTIIEFISRPETKMAANH